MKTGRFSHHRSSWWGTAALFQCHTAVKLEKCIGTPPLDRIYRSFHFQTFSYYIYLAWSYNNNKSNQFRNIIFREGNQSKKQEKSLQRKKSEKCLLHSKKSEKIFAINYPCFEAVYSKMLSAISLIFCQ